MVLTVKNITKSFDGNTVLEKVSFTVEQGKLVALIGPNGAGKSTLLSIVCGTLAYNAALNGEGSPSITLAGRPIGTHSNHDLVFITDRPGVYKHILSYDFLLFSAKMHAKPVEDIIHCAQKAGCAHFLDKPMGSLSRGQRQAVYLAAAFLVNPKIMVLDEPTVGLDPLQQKRIFQALQAFCKEGGAVLFSTHSLYEVEHMCDTLYMLTDKKIEAYTPALAEKGGDLAAFFTKDPPLNNKQIKA